MDPTRDRLRQLLKDYYTRYYAELRSKLLDYAAVPEQIPHFLRDHPRTITVIEYADGYVVTHRPSSASKHDAGASETFVIAADDRHRTVGEATGKANLSHSNFDESEAPFAREVGTGEYAEPTDFELRDYVSNDKVLRRTEEAARREAAEVIREFFEENPPMNLGLTLPQRKDRSVKTRLPLPFWGWKSRRSAKANVLYSLGFVALLIIGFSVYVGASILEDRGNQVQRVASVAVRDASQETTDLAAATEGAAIREGLEAAGKAEKEAQEEPAASRSAQQVSASSPASASAAPAATPPGTTMYLTIPKLGLYDIPVLEGTSEAVLSQGVGHVPGTGYPWLAGSNTYIAGHRLGYPGTVSDHVFWDLPSLVAGDQVILEDSLGQSYTYQVSEILEVSPADLSVTGNVGRDMVSLQTCIENYGDYWTPGPNWYVRYIVRAQRVA